MQRQSPALGILPGRAGPVITLLVARHTSKPLKHLASSVSARRLKRRGIGYRELAERLTAMGTPETDRNIANKISRGGFTAAFFLECLVAIGVQTLRLDAES
jgi:hypothetical protein